MPNTQTPYSIVHITTAGGSVGSVDCGGLNMAALAQLNGGSTTWTFETSNAPASTTYGTLRTYHTGVGVGTAIEAAFTGTTDLVAFSPPVGPIYTLRAWSLGTNQTAGTLAVYLRA